uniref:basic proline-rich protein-like n=1 Tax=Nyctereutes procyonoides TaxID=34880 RepID=UPI00244397E4|nr:basic proline-rich protein-like [Nyctereutes procyonoides]
MVEDIGGGGQCRAGPLDTEPLSTKEKESSSLPGLSEPAWETAPQAHPPAGLDHPHTVGARGPPESPFPAVAPSALGPSPVGSPASTGLSLPTLTVHPSVRGTPGGKGRGLGVLLEGKRPPSPTKSSSGRISDCLAFPSPPRRSRPLTFVPAEPGAAWRGSGPPAHASRPSATAVLGDRGSPPAPGRWLPPAGDPRALGEGSARLTREDSAGVSRADGEGGASLPYPGRGWTSRFPCPGAPGSGQAWAPRPRTAALPRRAQRRRTDLHADRRVCQAPRALRACGGPESPTRAPPPGPLRGRRALRAPPGGGWAGLDEGPPRLRPLPGPAPERVPRHCPPPRPAPAPPTAPPQRTPRHFPGPAPDPGPAPRGCPPRGPAPAPPPALPPAQARSGSAPGLAQAPAQRLQLLRHLDEALPEPLPRPQDTAFHRSGQSRPTHRTNGLTLWSPQSTELLALASSIPLNSPTQYRPGDSLGTLRAPAARSGPPPPGICKPHPVLSGTVTRVQAKSGMRAAHEDTPPRKQDRKERAAPPRVSEEAPAPVKPLLRWPVAISRQ